MDSLQPTSDSPTKRLLITVHGIRTRGEWQKELNAAASKSFIHEPLDFDFFPALKLVRDKKRREKIDWFRDKYGQLCEKHGDPRPCVIGHSLGSYIVARSMQIYPEIAFDRIILCGSIVSCDFPWSEFGENRFSFLLNDCGHADFWSKVVGFAVKDSGPSGVTGFSDNDPRILQRTHKEFRHSDYFYEMNYKQNWIPFLNGANPSPLTEHSKSVVNWRYRLAMGAICLLVLGASYWTWSHFARSNVLGDQASIEHEGGRSKAVLQETMLRKHERKSGAGLTESSKKIKRIPFEEQDQFATKLREAKSAGGSKWSTFCMDFTPCEVSDWTFAFQSELVVEQIDEASGISGIMVAFGNPRIRATCFLRDGEKSARYRQLDKGAQLTLESGVLEHIKPDGSLRLRDCKFNP